MTDPTPLRNLRDEPGATGRAARTLDLTCSNWQADRRGSAQVYWGVRGRTARGRSPLWTAGWALACCGLIGAGLWTLIGAPSTSRGLAVSAARLAPAAATPAIADLGGGSCGLNPAVWTLIDLGELGSVEVSPSALFEVADLDWERQFHLRAGKLRAQILRQDPERPFVVVTPHLRVVVVGTRFDVTIEGQRTTVQLIEGAVQVEAGAAALILQAGESIDSDDPRLRRIVVPVQPEPNRSMDARRGLHRARPTPSGSAASAISIAECEMKESLAAREQCLQRIAEGDGLAAQTALYSWGLLARDLPGGAPRALELLRLYQHRFPTGLLASEAALREIELLLGSGNTDEIVSRAAAFELRFASHPRADEVALVRANVLCAAGRRWEAKPLLGRLALAASPEVEKAARELRTRCEPEVPLNGAAGARRRTDVEAQKQPGD